MDNKKYYVRGFHQNVYEMISRYERTEARKIHKYNSRYFIVNGFLGKEIVRIFFIKYGHNQNWNIIITTDMTMLGLAAIREGTSTVRLPTAHSAT